MARRIFTGHASRAELAEEVNRLSAENALLQRTADGLRDFANRAVEMGGLTSEQVAEIARDQVRAAAA